MKCKWIKLLKKALANWIIKKRSPYTLLETLFRYRNTKRMTAKGQKKIFLANSNQKRIGVAILLLDKIHCKWKNGYKRQKGLLHVDKKVQQGQ